MYTCNVCAMCTIWKTAALDCCSRYTDLFSPLCPICVYNLLFTTTIHKDSNGCTALHYAVTLGHADATAMLLELGADPNRQDRKGRTPAHCGCAKGQFETVIQSNDSPHLLPNGK